MGKAACAEEMTQQSVLKEELAYRRYETVYAQREREAQRVYLLLTRMQPLQEWTKTFTKGYKVTLYSDSLRETALYAIYTNGPNLGCPKGQCEYVHYTPVFDS